MNTQILLATTSFRKLFQNSSHPNEGICLHTLWWAMDVI